MNADIHAPTHARIDFEVLTWLAVVLTAVSVLVVGASLVREVNLAQQTQAAEAVAGR